MACWSRPYLHDCHFSLPPSLPSSLPSPLPRFPFLLPSFPYRSRRELQRSFDTHSTEGTWMNGGILATPTALEEACLLLGIRLVNSRPPAPRSPRARVVLSTGRLQQSTLFVSTICIRPVSQAFGPYGIRWLSTWGRHPPPCLPRCGLC